MTKKTRHTHRHTQQRIVDGIGYMLLSVVIDYVTAADNQTPIYLMIASFDASR